MPLLSLANPTDCSGGDKHLYVMQGGKASEIDVAVETSDSNTIEERCCHSTLRAVASQECN